MEATIRRTIGRVAGASCLAAALCAGCSRPDFETGDAAAFEASCAAAASRISSDLRLQALKPAVAASVLLMAARPPAAPEVARRFDPGRPPQAAGFEAFDGAGVEAPCAAAAASAASYEGLEARTAFDQGLSRWMAALSSQASDVASMRREIKGAVEGRKSSTGRASALLDSFAPRALGYSVSQRGGRAVPTVSVAAVNPLDKPIQAFFFAVDLRRPNGTVLAQGRLTFTPAAPLNPGVEATYAIPLDGVAGFSDPGLVDLRGNVGVSVRVEDVLEDGVRLLNDTLLDPLDQTRITALSIVQGRIDDYRGFVRSVREREASTR